MSEPRFQHVAVIDLGSNTARLVVMKAIPGYSFRLQDEIREVVRLRQGMTGRGLSDAAISRAMSTLQLFRDFCHGREIDVILPTATSAVREASNGPAFVERVQQELGLSLRILSGEEEAYYATIGVLNEVPIAQGYVLDIGGGSLQVSEVCAGRFRRGQSLTLGALALTERFIEHDPPTPEEVAAVQAEIEAQLDEIRWLKASPQTMLVGLGGTIRNLARMEAVRQGYPLYTLHGFTLSRESVRASINLFCELPLAKRQKLNGLNSDRADIILPGALALLAVMRRLDVDALTVSMSGLREGVFLERFWRHLPYPVMPDVRRFSVLNLARIYQYQKNHANHVRYLAGRLFDQLAPLHGFGPPERELLDAGALLHDLGVIVGYDGHHRHSQTLIEFNGLAGYTPREIALIGLLARYHRKKDPDTSGYEVLLRAEDEGLVWQLAAILRLAEFLERGRNGNVDDVTARWTDEELRLTLIADTYPAVELWQAERNAVPLVEAAFGRRVVLDSIAAPSPGYQQNRVDA